MSETAPLLPQSVRNNLPHREQVEQYVPSKSQRIQVAESYGALKAGKMPSQDQISRAIDLVIKSDTLKATGGPNSRTARLGEEGARVLESTKGVLAAVKAWGEQKNNDDLLQNLIYNTTSAVVDIDVNGPSSSIKPTKTELAKDSLHAAQSFGTIAKLLLTSPSFRKLGSDFILLSREILADAADNAAEVAKEAADKARPSEKEQKEGVDFNDLKQKGKVGAKHTISGMYKAQAKEGAMDGAVNLYHYLDDKLPDGEEAKEKLVQRLQGIVTEAQGNKEYHQAINTLVDIVKKYANKAEEAVDETIEKTEVDGETEKIEQAGRDLKQFVENLAGTSLDPLIDALRTAAKDVRDDPKLSEYWDAVSQYVDRLLHDEGYVVSQRAYRKASSLYDDGQSLILDNPRWKEDASRLQKEFDTFLKALGNDKATQDLVDSIERLGDDLADAGQVGIGSLKVNGAGLYRDAVDVMLPRLISLVKEIPVPRIEFKSEDVDLVIDDLNLESASFIPDSIRFVAHNDFEFTQGYATYASEYDSTVRLRVRGMHLQASNIAYWFHKKTGYVTFEDSGLLDVQFGPDGLDFDVTLENAGDDDRESFFVVKNVDVHISGFDYQVRNNQKWFATWLAKPVLRRFLLSNITHTLEVQISEYLKNADLQLFALQQRTIAATNARPTPANYLKAIFSDSIFPSSSLGGVKVGQKGIVKYGRRGEFVLHVGVDEDLFPNQPPARVRNANRERARKKIEDATGVSVSGVKAVTKDAKKAKGEVEAEGRTLNRAARERQRRERREEGWRSSVFDI